MKEEPGEIDPEKAREQTKTLLQKILAADDVVGMRYRKGDLSAEKASKFCGASAVVVDGIMLEALKDREIAEAIVPILQDKIKERKTDPLPYKHFLQMLGYRHQLEIEGEVQDPAEIVEAFDHIKSRMDLDNIEERKEELEEKMGKRADRPRLAEEEQGNQMYG